MHSIDNPILFITIKNETCPACSLLLDLLRYFAYPPKDVKPFGSQGFPFVYTHQSLSLKLFPKLLLQDASIVFVASHRVDIPFGYLLLDEGMEFATKFNLCLGGTDMDCFTLRPLQEGRSLQFLGEGALLEYLKAKRQNVERKGAVAYIRGIRALDFAVRINDFKESSNGRFDLLPEELFVEIFSRLRLKDLLQCLRVCMRWEVIVTKLLSSLLRANLRLLQDCLPKVNGGQVFMGAETYRSDVVFGFGSINDILSALNYVNSIVEILKE